MKLAYWITTYSVYVCLGTALIFGYRSYSKIASQVKYLLWYLTAVAVIQGVSCILSEMSMPNMFLYPFYSAIELFLLGTFLLKLLESPSKFKYWLLIGSAIVLVEGVYKLSDPDSFFWGKPITHLLIVVGSGMFMYRRLNRAVVTKDETMFYLNAVVLGYFTISMIMFFFIRDLGSLSLTNAHLIWGIHNMFLLLFYSICAFVFYKKWN